MRTILSLVFTLVSIIGFSQTPPAQTGSVKGQVRTADGQPAEAVTITLKGTGRGTATDKTGTYELKKVKQGHYILQASFASHQAKETGIDVKAGETTTVADITLDENALELSQVVVSANRNNKKTDYVARLPLKDLENPQVYSVVSSEILKQQNVTSYDDAMRNVPGIARTWESTGRQGDGAAYFALRGLEAQTTMINGLPGLTNGNLDPADVERIEVIKGPTGTLFGSSIIAYGGLINTVTKRPYFDATGGEISYTAGSFGLNRITADVNLPVSKEKKMAFRLITAYHSEGSWQDAGFKKSVFLAPSFSYEVNDRLSFQFMTGILSEERAVGPIFFHTNRADPLPYKSVKDLNLNPNLSFTSNDLTIKNPRFNLQGQMIYKLSPVWTSQTVFSRGTSRSDGYYSYIWPDVTGVNFFGQYISNLQASTTTSDIQQNFTGDMQFGKIRNRIVIGLDAFSRNSIDNSTGYARIRNVSPQGEENFVDYGAGDTIAPTYLTRASVNAALAGTGGSNSNVTNSAYAIYVSDVINITPSLLAMVSARVDYFDSKGEKSDPTDDYHQTAVSPKFGLVWQPIIDKLSIFGNYMNGFVNQDPMQVGDPDGSNLHIKNFRPIEANQWETGFKLNLAEKLNVTASYYDIRISNRITGDPDNFYNYLQGGKMESKGYELELASNPVKGFNLIAGYSHNDSKVLVGDKNDFYSTPGRAAGGQGPNNLINFWATYKFSNGALRNCGIGFGGNHAGAYKVIDSDITGDFYLPAYTVLNASLFYNNDNIRVSINVNNLTSEQYYIGYWSVNPQKPRAVTASFAYKF